MISNPSSSTSKAIKKIAADLVGYELEETEEVESSESEDNSQIKKIIKALKNL